jgi:hypothetical protein
LLVSAERRAGQTAWVRVRATAKSALRLASPFPGQDVYIRSNTDSVVDIYPACVCSVVEREMVAGEELVITKQ